MNVWVPAVAWYSLPRHEGCEDRAWSFRDYPTEVGGGLGEHEVQSNLASNRVVPKNAVKKLSRGMGRTVELIQGEYHEGSEPPGDEFGMNGTSTVVSCLPGAAGGPGVVEGRRGA